MEESCDPRGDDKGRLRRNPAFRSILTLHRGPPWLQQCHSISNEETGLFAYLERCIDRDWMGLVVSHIPRLSGGGIREGPSF